MRIAMLGLGFMGGVHLRAWREVAGATLAAVFSNDARQLSGDLTATQGNLGRPGERVDFSAVKRYSDLDDVLGDSEIDAVDLCLPTYLHEDAAGGTGRLRRRKAVQQRGRRAGRFRNRCRGSLPAYIPARRRGGGSAARR